MTYAGLLDGSITSGAAASWLSIFDWLCSENRYHLHDVQKEQFEAGLNAMIAHCMVDIPVGSEFYRARLHPPRNRERELPIPMSPEPLPADQLQAPPKPLCIAGRLNPAGIRYLYLADSAETAMHEIPVFPRAFVTIATFKVTVAQSVVSLSADKLAELEDQAMADWLRCAGRLLSWPHHPNDPLESVPTQFVSSAIRARGIDGIQYQSAALPGGLNTALFWAGTAEVSARSFVQVGSTSVQWDVRSEHDA